MHIYIDTYTSLLGFKYTLDIRLSFVTQPDQKQSRIGSIRYLLKKSAIITILLV